MHFEDPGWNKRKVEDEAPPQDSCKSPGVVTIVIIAND